MHEARKILVPVNFSEKSGSGLEYAVSLAEETQAELVVLHVAKKSEAEAFLDLLAIMEGSPVLNLPPAIPVDRLLCEKALDLHRFIERVVRNPGRLKINRKIAILEIVKDESIDLVVLPVRKRSFFLI
jgi:nucleotide-binding universal stress UspA family protein